jgi:hypothetical protein
MKRDETFCFATMGEFRMSDRLTLDNYLISCCENVIEEHVRLVEPSSLIVVKLRHDETLPLTLS